MKARIALALKRLLGLLPSPLPQGMTEFDTWAHDIAATYKLPTSDVDSIKFTLATMIMHLGPTVAYKPKYHFVLALRAGAAKQVAGQAFHDIKIKQKEAAAKAAADEAAAKAAESV